MLSTILNSAISISNSTVTINNGWQSYFGLIPLLIGLSIICIISELVEEGVVSFIGLLIVSILTFSITHTRITATGLYNGFGLKNILLYSSLYLLLGVIYGFIRTYYFAKDYKRNYNSQVTSLTILEKVRERHLFRWILLFPFSLVLWGISKWLKEFYFACFGYIKSLLLKIIEVGLK